MPLSSPTCGQLRIPLIFLLTNLSKYLKRRLLPRATLPKISRSSGACHVLLPTLTYSKMPVIDIRLSDSLSLPKHSSSMCTYTSKRHVWTLHIGFEQNCYQILMFNAPSITSSRNVPTAYLILSIACIVSSNSYPVAVASLLPN